MELSQSLDGKRTDMRIVLIVSTEQERQGKRGGAVIELAEREGGLRPHAGDAVAKERCERIDRPRITNPSGCERGARPDLGVER